MYINNNLKWLEMRTSREGGTWSCLILALAVAQKQIATPCEMRKAKIWPPQWVSKILWYRGQQWVLQWTRNSGQHSRWLLNNLPIFSSTNGWEYCFMLDSPSRHNVHTMAPHVWMTRDGFSQTALGTYHHRMSTSHFYLALTSWYGVVSWFLSGISFITSYKINSHLV